MKKFGIRVSLPPGDPMSAPHLLGADFRSERWFDSQEKRDRVYAEMYKQFAYYRRGDTISQRLEKVEKDE